MHHSNPISKEKFDRIITVDADEKITEKEILQKIISAKRKPVKMCLKTSM